MRLNNLILGTTLATGVALAASTTFAAPITTGTIGLSLGTYQAEDAAGNNVALGSAVALDFSAQNAGAPSTANTGSFVVGQLTGGFLGLGLSIGQTGTIHDLVFSPFSQITSFFVVGGLSFDLLSLNVTSQDDTGITLVGSGKFQPGTADETAGTWSISVHTDGSNPTGEFTWSANATAVPEPATLAVLGATLLGLGAIRRRKA